MELKLLVKEAWRQESEQGRQTEKTQELAEARELEKNTSELEQRQQKEE